MTERARTGHEVRREVGLALRADRRRRGQSQRAYATERGISRSTLARAELDPAQLALRTVLTLLEGTGFSLAIIPEDSELPEVTWDETDLAARTRAGGRFPANREVRKNISGPMWWWYHEVLGNRGFGPEPEWTAEGFDAQGVRYGKLPRPYEPGEPPRFPAAVWPDPDEE